MVFSHEWEPPHVLVFFWISQLRCLCKASWKVCLCKKLFESYDQTLINFISIINENENSEDNSNDDNGLQEPHVSDDDVPVDEYFSWE